MTLRHFVDAGTIGTPDERAAFEQAVLDGLAEMAIHGVPVSLRLEQDLEFWTSALVFWRKLQV